jgi:hypothetical protein
MQLLKALIAAVALTVLSIGVTAAADPLPSWNDGANKKAIFDLSGR